MASRYVLSPRALKDLRHIWDMTVQNWGVAQAERYTNALDNRCAMLAENPMLGRARDEVRTGLRSFPEGRHLIFYRVNGDVIEIVGFPHQRQDIDSSMLGR